MFLFCLFNVHIGISFPSVIGYEWVLVNTIKSSVNIMFLNLAQLVSIKVVRN